jgi:phenylalanyl-tRNA synthetase beta chain
MHEIVGWSFTAPDLHDRLRLDADDPRRRAVRVENPMSEDESVLRTTLLGSLLDAARHNAARGMPDVALFEAGAVYLDDRAATGSPLPTELHALGGLLCGRLAPATWGAPEPPRASFFAAKGLLGALFEALRVEWAVERAPEPFLHPGRSAAVLVGGRPVGWLGEVHPLVAGGWDLDAASAFEVDLGAVVAAAPRVERYEDLLSFPAVRQDLALVVGEDVPAAEVVSVVREAGGRLLRAAEVFDVYAGAQVGEGRRSLALHLEFRAPDRTLTDEEAAAVRKRIVAAVRERLGGDLRA